jgi:hypothetical protein
MVVSPAPIGGPGAVSAILYQQITLSITSFDSCFEDVFCLLQLSVEVNKKEGLFNLPISFGSFRSRCLESAIRLCLFHYFLFRLYRSVFQPYIDLSVPHTLQSSELSLPSSRAMVGGVYVCCIAASLPS